MKTTGVAYLLWFFLGSFSAHRFYVGKTGTAILYLITGQLFFIGWVIDAFMIPGMVKTANLEMAAFGGQQQSNNQVQNVVVNVQAPAPVMPPPPTAPIEESAE